MVIHVYNITVLFPKLTFTFMDSNSKITLVVACAAACASGWYAHQLYSQRRFKNVPPLPYPDSLCREEFRPIVSFQIDALVATPEGRAGTHQPISRNGKEDQKLKKLQIGFAALSEYAASKFLIQFASLEGPEGALVAQDIVHLELQLDPQTIVAVDANERPTGDRFARTLTACFPNFTNLKTLEVSFVRRGVRSLKDKASGVDNGLIAFGAAIIYRLHQALPSTVEDIRLALPIKFHVGNKPTLLAAYQFLEYPDLKRFSLEIVWDKPRRRKKHKREKSTDTLRLFDSCPRFQASKYLESFTIRSAYNVNLERSLPHHLSWLKLIHLDNVTALASDLEGLFVTNMPTLRSLVLCDVRIRRGTWDAVLSMVVPAPRLNELLVLQRLGYDDYEDYACKTKARSYSGIEGGSKADIKTMKALMKRFAHNRRSFVPQTKLAEEVKKP